MRHQSNRLVANKTRRGNHGVIFVAPASLRRHYPRSGSEGCPIALDSQPRKVSNLSLCRLNNKLLKANGLRGAPLAAILTLNFQVKYTMRDGDCQTKHKLSGCKTTFAYTRFSGFSPWRYSGTNRPSFRMSSSSNHISPPPYSGV